VRNAAVQANAGGASNSASHPNEKQNTRCVSTEFRKKSFSIQCGFQV